MDDVLDTLLDTPPVAVITVKHYLSEQEMKRLREYITQYIQEQAAEKIE